MLSIEEPLTMGSKEFGTVRLSGRKKLFFCAASILFGLAPAFLISELVLRMIVPGKMFYRINISSTEGNYALTDNPRLIYVPVPNTGDLNEYGHRGKAFPFEKNDRKRIVVMGDSVVEGLGVALGERFSDNLERLLDERYEMINLGVCGYSLLQEFEYFKRLGEEFSPDVVLWFITYNDMRLSSGEIHGFNHYLKTAPNSAFYEAYYKTRTGLNRLLMRSFTYNLVRYACAARAQKIFNNNEEKISLKDADNLLRQINDMARANHFRLMFIFLPLNTDMYASEMNDLRRLMVKNNAPCLDLRESFKSYPGSVPVEKYFLQGDPCHFSVEGNRVFAEILYHERVKLGL
jgi:lysophospholipase L1-like esterase